MTLNLSKQLKVACLQLNAKADIQENLNTVAQYLEQAAKQGVQLIVLPENFAFIAANHRDSQENARKYPLILNFLAQKSQQFQMCIMATSIMQIQQEFVNRCVYFSHTGKLLATYDKIHLFDAKLSSESWSESSYIQAGSKPVMVDFNHNWKLGLSICYDLRFPELFRHYSQHGCNILCISAAFTTPTGMAHWHVLLRARAIENQCYVLASAQCGEHADGRRCYGHSLIIDPWGEIMHELDQQEGLVQATLDMDKLQHIRDALPALLHRKDIV